jgi:HSP20 family molecular chaperone IbpA
MLKPAIKRIYNNNITAITLLCVIAGSLISTPNNYANNIDIDNTSFFADHVRELKKIQEQMDKIFDQAFTEFNPNKEFKHKFLPILKDDQDKFIISMNITKSQSSSIEVTLKNQKLTISGDFNDSLHQKDKNNKAGHYQEYSGKFIKSLILPDAVQEKTLETKLKDDQVIITVQKTNKKIKLSGNTSNAL